MSGLSSSIQPSPTLDTLRPGSGGSATSSDGGRVGLRLQDCNAGRHMQGTLPTLMQSACAPPHRALQAPNANVLSEPQLQR